MKEQDTISEEESEVEIADLLKKQFRGTILKMMEELGRRMYAQSDKSEVFKQILKKYKE